MSKAPIGKKNVFFFKRETMQIIAEKNTNGQIGEKIHVFLMQMRRMEIEMRFKSFRYLMSLWGEWRKQYLPVHWTERGLR